MRAAPRAGGGKGFQRASLDMRQRSRHRVKHDIHAIGDQVRMRLSAAAIGHVFQLDPGTLGKQYRRQAHHATRAGKGHARVALGIIHQFSRRIGREGFRRTQHQRCCGGLRDEGEIPHGIEGQPIKRRIDRVRNRNQAKRMPIRRAARHHFRADHAIRPGAVFHWHRMAPSGGQGLSDQPRRDVRNAPRRIGHNHAHGAIGKAALRPGTDSKQ